jgi:hypothetical protein
MIPRPGPVRWILEGISLDREGGPWCCHLAADGSTISEIDSLIRINLIFNPKSPLAGTKVATQIFDSRMNLEHLCSCGCRTFGERTGIQGPNSSGRPKVFLPLRARPILMQPPVCSSLEPGHHGWERPELNGPAYMGKINENHRYVIGAFSHDWLPEGS